MLTKQDAKMSQGLAIISMVLLHLFCRYDLSIYNVRLIIGNVPLLYYIGLFGDICVPIYCFSSGYAQAVLCDKEQENYKHNRLRRLFKFLIHFWIILCCFSVVGWSVGNSEIPGGIWIFLGNFLLYKLSYNGAWWFVLTYVFLIVLSPVFICIVKKKIPIIIFLESGFIYCVTYVLYFNYKLSISNVIFSGILEQMLLLGRCQFMFVIGILFYRYNIVGWLRSKLERGILRKIVVVTFPIVMFIVHCFIQSLVIAPITGIVTLTCFHLWNKPQWVKEFFTFFGRHSTNLWLTHMFFYLTLFTGFIYVCHEPIAVCSLLLAICVVVSYSIDGIEKILQIGFHKLGKR